MNDFLELAFSDCVNRLVFPPLAGDPNCFTSLVSSQVSDLYCLPYGVDPPADWKEKQAWEVYINNSEVSPTAGRWLVGIGGVEAPEKTTMALPKGRRQVSDRVYTLRFRVDNLTDSNYLFALAVQRGNKDFAFWYGSTGERVFGGPRGIRPLMVDADLPLLSGDSDTEFAELLFSFRSNSDPLRFGGVPAAGDGGGVGEVGTIPEIWGESETELWGEFETELCQLTIPGRFLLRLPVLSQSLRTLVVPT